MLSHEFYFVCLIIINDNPKALYTSNKINKRFITTLKVKASVESNACILV